MATKKVTTSGTAKKAPVSSAKLSSKSKVAAAPKKSCATKATPKKK